MTHYITQIFNSAFHFVKDVSFKKFHQTAFGWHGRLICERSGQEYLVNIIPVPKDIPDSIDMSDTEQVEKHLNLWRNITPEQIIGDTDV